MHVASFAGIAPVNNPVIAVAVVIDTPKGASYYGAHGIAPVFAEVAQQVLEYLGVPHDIDMQPHQDACEAREARARRRSRTTRPTSTRCSRRSTICLPTIRCASLLRSRLPHARRRPRSRSQPRRQNRPQAAATQPAVKPATAALVRSSPEIAVVDERRESVKGASTRGVAGAQGD